MSTALQKENLVFGFDYDGTIINIEPQKAAAFGNILQKQWRVDQKEAADFWIQTGGTSRRYKFDYFYSQRFGRQLSDKDYRIIEQEFSNTLKTVYYPLIELLPYAKGTLEFVRSRFGFVFISSGVPMEEIRFLVKLNNVERYFDLILGTNAQYKSKKDHFREINTSHHPSVLIYLADGLEDMRVAKEFSAVSIALPTNHSRAALQEAGAQYICNLQEVPTVVEAVLQSRQ